MNFPSLEAAYGWLSELVDDYYVGNYWFAYSDTNEGVGRQPSRTDLSCVQTYEVQVEVAGRSVKIGCDYGH